MTDAAGPGLIRQVEHAEQEVWDDQVRGKVGFRTLFSGDITPTTALTTGVAELLPGGLLALHHHDPAETYYILEGRGVVTVGEEDHEVAGGASVFIPGGTVHAIRNTGAQPLRFFYVLAADSLTEVTYHFVGASGAQDPA